MKCERQRYVRWRSQDWLARAASGSMRGGHTVRCAMTDCCQVGVIAILVIGLDRAGARIVDALPGSDIAVERFVSVIIHMWHLRCCVVHKCYPRTITC